MVLPPAPVEEEELVPLEVEELPLAAEVPVDADVPDPLVVPAGFPEVVLVGPLPPLAEPTALVSPPAPDGFPPDPLVLVEDVQPTTSNPIEVARTRFAFMAPSGAAWSPRLAALEGFRKQSATHFPRDFSHTSDRIVPIRRIESIPTAPGERRRRCLHQAGD